MGNGEYVDWLSFAQLHRDVNDNTGRIIKLETEMTGINKQLEISNELAQAMHRENKEAITAQNARLEKLSDGQQETRTTVKVAAGVVGAIVVILELVAHFVHF